MAVLLCRSGEVFREEMAFELGLTAWVGVCRAEKGGKGTPGKETAYGKIQSLKEWHIQRMVRSSLWLKRRGHVGDEKRWGWQGLWRGKIGEASWWMSFSQRHWRLCNGSMAHSRISLVISERTSGSVDRLKLGRLSDRHLYPENNDAQCPCYQALTAYTWTFFVTANLWDWIRNMKNEE